MSAFRVASGLLAAGNVAYGGYKAYQGVQNNNPQQFAGGAVQALGATVGGIIGPLAGGPMAASLIHSAGMTGVRAAIPHEREQARQLVNQVMDRFK